jgi:hypothetical protein
VKHEKKLKKLLKEEMDSPLVWRKTIEDYVIELDEHLTLLEDEGFIQIVLYSNDMLPELVERSIKRIKPFSDKKLEFRDGIIWFSYVAFAEEHNFEYCYLITNNSEDFMKNNELHPELAHHSAAFTIYKNAEDFIQNCEEAQSLKRRLDWVDEQDFPNKSNVVLRIIAEQCFDTVHDACANFVNNSNNMPVPRGIITFDTEWFDLNDIALTEVKDIEVSVVLDTIIISGYLTVETDYEIYERNPSYEKGDEEYFRMGSGEANLYVKFSLTIDEELEVEDMDIDDIGLE